MKKEKYTSGPWSMGAYGNKLSITGSESAPVLICEKSVEPGDMRLILSAPEMVKALENARIALTFYREWMAEAKPGTDYPFGIDTEKQISAILK